MSKKFCLECGREIIGLGNGDFYHVGCRKNILQVAKNCQQLNNMSRERKK